MRYCALHKNWYAFDHCPDCLAPVIPVLDSKTIDPEHLSIDQNAETDPYSKIALIGAGEPEIKGKEEGKDFWENMPVHWIKWTKRKPDWNGSVYMQYNGKNQGMGLVFDEALIKLDGLDESEFSKLENTFYWLEQKTDYLNRK